MFGLKRKREEENYETTEKTNKSTERIDVRAWASVGKLDGVNR